jgi:3-oxoadipate enol-lactonase
VNVQTERGTFGVRKTGDGPPIVLLHPLALSGAVWDPLAEHLADRFTVLSVDARGHGQSTWDGRPFTVEDLAADVVAVVTAVDAGPVGVIGLSMGGSTACVLAARYPEVVSRLVLADTTACYGDDRVEKWAERERTATGVPRPEQLGFQVDRWFSARFRAAEPAEVARVSEIFLATDSAAHAAACVALGALDATAELGAITAPTLVLVGEEDYATPVPMARRLADGIPDATLHVLPETRHLSLVERPEIWPLVAAHFQPVRIDSGRGASR